MNNTFFFQTQQITNHTILFNQLKEQNIFFSYFQVDQNYYLFLYAQKSIDIHFLYQSLDVIQELDSKQRKIRSLRGFFLYALEIFERTNNSQILKTNLKPSFWRNLKSILRQNKKTVLLQFLFGTIETKLDIEEKIQILETQVSSLQQKLMNLESKLENSEYALNGTREGLESSKISQQGNNSPLKSLRSLNLLSNDSHTADSSRFKKPSDIPKQDLIEIIEKGFRLNQEGEIKLREYYEEKGKNTLFEDKKYSLKHGGVRNTKLYKDLNSKRR